MIIEKLVQHIPPKFSIVFFKQQVNAAQAVPVITSKYLTFFCLWLSS